MIDVVVNDLWLITNNLTHTLALFEKNWKLKAELLENETAVINLGNEVQLCLKQDEQVAQTEEIRLVTSDCIAAYCLLKSNGIEFANMPSYSSRGVTAEFFDACGNSFFLVEPRNYKEQ